MDAKLQKLITYHAIGDSLLLPYEFMHKSLIPARLKKYGLSQSLVAGYGLTSDDNDHLLLSVQALLETSSIEDFKKSLSRKLKIWLLTLPIGIGATTLKSILKMIVGFKGGIHSAGNGPLMRVPAIAFYFADNPILRASYIEASTTLTHTSPQALSASIGIGNFIAYLATYQKIPDKSDLKAILAPSNEPVWSHYCQLLLDNMDLKLEDFLVKINSQKGVSGYIMPSAIFSIYTLYHQEHPFLQIIRAGGDTDTIGALVGAYLSFTGELHQDKYLFNKIKNNLWPQLLMKNILLIPVVLWHTIFRFLLLIRCMLS